MLPQFTVAPVTKFVPLIVSVNAAPPAVAAAGERREIVGAGAPIVYAATATPLLSYPDAVAMALTVSLLETVIGPV